MNITILKDRTKSIRLMSQTQFDVMAILAEMLGTYVIVIVGGMALLQYDSGILSLISVALINFVIISTMTNFAFPISKAHFNPVITLSCMVTKKIELVKGAYYIISQLIGSLLAGITLSLFTPDSFRDGAIGHSELGYPHIAGSVTQGLAMEIFLTFLLVFTFWAVIIDTRSRDLSKGIAIGSIYFLGILIGSNISGAAMNPARVIGPAVVSLDMKNQWVYWIGPVIGSLLASIFYSQLLLPDDDVTE